MYKEIKHTLRIISNEQLTYKTWRMVLEGDIREITDSGQFINIALPGKYLRRPISVSDFAPESGRVTILYDTVGSGTKEMSEMQEGEALDVLVGLGNGFSDPRKHKKVLLLGGGIGVAPLYRLALECKEKGVEPIVILGFNTRNDVIPMKQWLKDEGIETHLATVDGTEGTKGFVTDVIKEKEIKGDYFYACGPMPMLKALCTALQVPGEVSLESRMGCGFGICMCCSVQTKDGAKRICKDGPVFRKEELIWK